MTPVPRVVADRDPELVEHRPMAVTEPGPGPQPLRLTSLPRQLLRQFAVGGVRVDPFGDAVPQPGQCDRAVHPCLTDQHLLGLHPCRD